MSSGRKFEGEIEAEESTWSSIKSKLDGADRIQKAGLALSGLYAGTVALESDDIVNMTPEKLSIGDTTVHPEAWTKDVEEFVYESVLGPERETDVWWEEITRRTDCYGHYTVSYLGAKALCKGVDRASSELDIFSDEYDPKKIVAAGLATAPMYFALKEGYIEGPGFDFNLSSMDQQADLMYDTAGAIHATYNYHKERTAQGDEEYNGLIGDAMHGLGRTYGKVSEFGKEYLKPSENMESSEEPTDGSDIDHEPVYDFSEDK